MSRTTKVVRNRIYIDERAYDAKVLGGGKFDVTNAAGVRIGSFQVRGRAVEAEDLEIEGADSVELIGVLWVRENLSPMPEAKPAIAIPPSPAPTPPVAAAPPATIAAPPAPAPSKPQIQPAGASTTGIADPALRPICRVATHAAPDAASLQKALGYQAWLREQAGVTTAVLSRDPQSGKVMSIAIWENREKFNAMRYAKPPASAVQLPALSVEISEVFG
ncbi:MAG: hypothetical protein HOV80_31785 [Polyangiaceae bacterium]|nr:hypothetical protein [Polyangiaceae bacterium]